MKNKWLRVRRLKETEQGYTLLEYCAGATVIAVVVYAALNALGVQLNNFLTELGNWAGRRAQEITRN